MPRTAARVAVCLLIATTAGSTATAADYTPVHCDTREIYAGRPLHAAVAVAPAPGALADTDFDAATVQRLDHAFGQIRSATAAPSIGAAIAVPGVGSWSASHTEADAPLLYWASAGKTFTAVVVLQLAEEGRLSLDTPVSHWIDDVPNGKAITLRDLLAHTSGLFSANEDRKSREKPRYRSVEENLAIARRHGAMFCAGANWRYSNTGYDLLGAIVQKVDGRPLDQAITARIIDKLGLRHTRALNAGSDTSGIAPLVSAKEKPIDPRWPGAAGPIAADAADMLRFWAALLNGQLLKPQTVADMSAAWYPMFDAGTYYGLGAMLFDVPDGERRNLWIGHAGGTPGAGALVIYSPQDKAFVAVALTGDGPAGAAVNAMLKAWRASSP
ncbi:D-alanyl-D-alanine carboxypeptidase [Tahibacter aquaticus]|uniref:D-alanyl-D-alanine carboxypeptidase n=1 Tax=Tahibacter aquaticus TaxID=520092 RepID=A0A4R6YPG1_9GAMM|nr:serine hydrolase domain-containing protein [Tahibacter aquaticus]TDR39477.1 D-alanyl-D-alanine carboxypeptidase [Tahibacter aquaticus]